MSQSVEEVVAGVQNGVTIAAGIAEAAAPIVAVFNPGIGAAMTLLTPIAEKFIIKGGDLIVSFRQDLTPEQLVELLKASKSVNWPEVGSIERV